MDINSIENPEFLKKLSKKELKALCRDIRTFLIEHISKTGGHLASNLGVVELTVGLHYVFNDSNDKIIFDVGHQAYTHKILTGRAKKFNTLRQTNGLSGFINYDESKYDCWESGHSSNSLSAMAGFLLSKKNGDKNINNVVSLIGDSSIANGMAFEGLNFLTTIKGERPIIILNDNKMGISKSVGATTKVFNAMRGSKFYRINKKILIKINPRFVVNWFHQIKRGIKAFVQIDNIFEDMGYDYFGPYDGNDLNDVIHALERAKNAKGPCVVHFITKKGLGYMKAEQDEKGSYHGVSPFDIETGKALKVFKEDEYSYSEIISKTLINLRKTKDFILINPATIVGNRLNKFQQLYPESIYDVGIAEEHAASMAGAIALNKKNVLLLVYSTFAQRAYDQILNDVCRRNLHVIFGFDRAGLVAEEGSTHQGIYDIAMLNSMPNISICMGKDLAESKALMEFSFNVSGPIVIRYPKSCEIYTKDVKIDNMKWEILHNGNKGVVISYGPDVLRILKLVTNNNLDIMVVNARFIRPLDYDLLNNLYMNNMKILVIEQVIKNGSLGQMISYDLVLKNMKNEFNHLALENDTFVIQASYEDLLSEYKLDDSSILQELKKLCD